MNKLVLTTAVLGMLASPAFAEQSKNPFDSFAQTPPVSKHRSVSAKEPKTFDVIVNGTIIGKAPDDAIRAAMISDYYSSHSGDGGGDGGGSDN